MPNLRRRCSRAGPAAQGRRPALLPSLLSQDRTAGRAYVTGTKRLMRLPALRDELPGHYKSKPVEWTMTRRTDGQSTGRAWSRDRVHFSIAHSADAPVVRALIAHELAHYVLRYHHGHDDRWSRLFARVLREAYGVTVDARLDRHKIHRAAIDALRGTQTMEEAA